MKCKRTGRHIRLILFGAIIYAASLITAAPKEGHPNPDHVFLPSGQLLTPLATPGAQLQYLELRHRPQLIAGGAMTMTVSPDQRTLLVLTSGYNRLSNWLGQLVDDAFTEYVFVYDISNPLPVKKQIIKIPDSFAGIAFSPDGRKFYAGGGRHDNIYVYALRANGSWAEAGSPVELKHKGANGLYREKTPSVTGGLSLTADGSKLIIANVYNDSISVVDLKNHAVVDGIDLRPGKINSSQAGVAGGEYPFWVVVKGNDTVYVSSVRDREIVVLDISAGRPFGNELEPKAIRTK